MLKLHVIEDFNEFENLRNVWNSILQRSFDNNIFSTWEWLWCWWKHFGKSRELRLMIIEEDGKVAGFAPLMVSNYSFRHFGELRRVEFIGSPHADYNNFILLKKEVKYAKLFLDGLMEYSDWELLDLRDIHEESVSAELLRSLCSKENPLKLIDGTLCPYIRLPSSVDSFIQSLSRNMRRNLRKRVRKLHKRYRVEFKSQRDFDSVDEAMRIFFKLHQERWKSKGEPGVFSSEDFRNFHTEIAKIFDEKGWLDLHFLTVDDEPVAAAYTFNYNLKKYGYLTGFDPTFRKYGVGNLLKMHLVEECIKKGFREYDLTRGFEPYKADWATNVRKNFVVRFVRRGLFVKMYCWALENSFLQRFFNKLGVRLTVKSS